MKEEIWTTPHFIFIFCVGKKKKITYLKVGIVLRRRLIQDSSVGVGMLGSSEGNLQGMVHAV